MLDKEVKLYPLIERMDQIAQQLHNIDQKSVEHCGPRIKIDVLDLIGKLDAMSDIELNMNLGQFKTFSAVIIRGLSRFLPVWIPPLVCFFINQLQARGLDYKEAVELTMNIFLANGPKTANWVIVRVDFDGNFLICDMSRAPKPDVTHDNSDALSQTQNELFGGLAKN